jgi:protein-S-isoprenylcysteine O-methyltransferase Ste14
MENKVLRIGYSDSDKKVNKEKLVIQIILVVGWLLGTIAIIILPFYIYFSYPKIPQLLIFVVIVMSLIFFVYFQTQSNIIKLIKPIFNYPSKIIFSSKT